MEMNNEHEYEKGQYYNECYDDDLDLVTTDESSYSGESEADSKWEMFEVQDKQLSQHNKQKWSIFCDQLSLLTFSWPQLEKKVSLA